MPILFFLPWVPRNHSRKVGPVTLLPFIRNKEPGALGGISQTQIDAVLGNYANRAYGSKRGSMGAAVSDATILWWEGDERGEPVSTDEISERLSFCQLLTFSALSERRFCTHFAYCNSDGVAAIAQHFDPSNPAAVAYTTRRRDVSSKNMVAGASSSPIFLRPLHVDANQCVEIDFDLLAALSAIPAGDFRERVLDSIELFNRANTDASEVSDGVELVLLRSAFETLLETDHKTKELVRAFRTHFETNSGSTVWYSGKLCESVWRARWPKDVERPLDAWVQDFCNARNSSAHGGSSGSKHTASIWTSRNHLLFGSWLFPLMVKALLAEQGAYTMKPMDIDFRDGCESFLSEDVLSESSEGKLYWSDIDSSLRQKAIARALCSSMSGGPS